MFSTNIKVIVISWLVAVICLPFGSMADVQFPSVMNLLTASLLASLPSPGLNLEETSMRVDHPVHSGEDS